MSKDYSIPILINYASDAMLIKIKKALKPIHYKTIKLPESGLIMMQVKDCYDIGFNLGEVSLSTAEIEFKGIRGFGAIIGNQPEKVLVIALVDAIMQSDETSVKKKIHKLLNRLSEKRHSSINLEKRWVWSTQVNFETLAKNK